MGIGSVLGVAGSLLDGGKSSTIDRLTQENAQLKDQIRELEEQVKKLTKSAQVSREQLEAQEEEVDDLEDEVVDLKKKLKTKDVEIAYLKDVISDLTITKEQLKVELGARK